MPDVEKARSMLRRRLQSIPDIFQRMVQLNDHHYLFMTASQREVGVGDLKCWRFEVLVI